MQHRDTVNAHPNPRQKSDIIIWIVMVILLTLLAVKISSPHGSFAFSGQVQRTILVTEFMPSNTGTITNEDGTYCDWIELYNPADHPIDLKGYSLTDDAKMPDKCVLPSRVLEPGEYAIVYADDRPATDTELHAPFRLKDADEILIMLDPDDTEIQRITYPPMESNQSYAMALDTQEWAATDRCTPGLPNTDSGYEAYRESRKAVSPVMINEIMAGNTVTLRDEDGDYPDWVELYNASEETVDLTGWGLSDTADRPKRWKFPATQIGPAEYMIVYVSGKNRTQIGEELHTNFKLNAHRDALLLTNFRGQSISEVQISDLKSDHAYALVPGTSTWQVSTHPTPGNPNDEAGWTAFQSGLYAGTDTPVIISEIMSNNTEILKYQSDMQLDSLAFRHYTGLDTPVDVSETMIGQSEECPDWIELYNRSDGKIDLTGWGLTDDTDALGRWRFPSCILEPGEFITVYASEQKLPDESPGGIRANFQIGSEGDIIALSDPTGQAADFCFVPPLRAGLTYQREPDASCFTYCDHATPNHANAKGFMRITPEPTFSLTAGMYDVPRQVMLSAEPGARIYYTLDGTFPDENSIPYTEPIRLKTTAAVRAAAYQEGDLPSNAVCATYLIGENIDLPVVSIVTDPANLFDEETGIYMDGPGWTSKFPYLGANYWQDWERPAHVELLEPDGTVGISQDIGLKIFGAVSRARTQKPFSLMARDRYGEDSFGYQVFPELPYTDYKNLILRNGQDANYSHIRDKLQVDLALETSNVDGQAHRQCIVFINAEFWGLYDLAEKVNEHFISLHHGVDPDQIDLLWGNGDPIIGSNKEYMELIEFVKNHDLSVQENYEYVASRVDIDNYIDWCAIEIYVAHEDLDGNTKYWKPRTPDGKWRWILYDLDYGFWHLYQPEYADRLDAFSMFLHPKGNGNNHQGDNTLIRGLLQNEGFRQKFIERFVYHCTVTFAPDKVLPRIDELAANIEPYMERDKRRWPTMSVGTMDTWRQEHLQLLRDFAVDRPGINLHYMQQYFGLTDAEMERLLTYQYTVPVEE